MREERTEVLVVGAGPVGLASALLLAEAGLEVSLIDREERTTARSYACALHPSTLELLDRLGLATLLLEHGRRVPTVALYDGEERRAEVRLSALSQKFPFLLILPQSALETALEQRLRKAGIIVNWNHRFAGFQDETAEVAAIIEELGGTSTGYIVPHWETIVKRRTTLRAQFIVGADGRHSMVRQRLGLDSERAGGTESFAAYEFEAEKAGEDEVRIVLDNASTNVLWPLPGNKYRWTFQMAEAGAAAVFPEKERRAARLASPVVDEKIRQYVQKIAGERAPWFSMGVKEITWCTRVVFEHELVRQFGRNRCWLAGDAAHQTGPAGVQSMNAGFLEAEALAESVRKVVRENGSMQLFEAYNRQWREQWRRLLGLAGGLKGRAQTSEWIRGRAGRILPCLPGVRDLGEMARQIGLEFE
jgi:2-polyprenyl-6-methoxyphenol hydroxylase-like FAD-dependent oxidoreductase